MPEDGVVEEMRLAETGVMHYVGTCWYCGMNLCDHSLRQQDNDDSINNFQLGSCVIGHGGSVYIIEEDGVAGSHNWLVVWNIFYFSIYWE